MNSSEAKLFITAIYENNLSVDDKYLLAELFIQFADDERINMLIIGDMTNGNQFESDKFEKGLSKHLDKIHKAHALAK